MIKRQMLLVLLEGDQSLRTLHAEVIQLLCDTGLSRNQARRLWLHSVLGNCYSMAECWNIPHIQSLLKKYVKLFQVKNDGDSNA
jgi:hypothetical protein